MQPTDMALLAGIALVALVLIMLMGGGKRKVMQKRIAQLQKRHRSTVDTSQESLRRKTTELKGLILWLSEPLPQFSALGEKLERAGKDITPKQYALRRVLMALVIAVFLSVVLKKSIWLGAFFGMVFGIWLPLKFLQFLINKQSKAFIGLFPDAIDLIVRGLRSGLPVSESLILVSHEVPNPVGSTFMTISNTMKLGVPMEKALQETARKLDLTEFNFFTTSIILQRETGGNLAEILNNLSEVLRNRYLMRMKIRAMSSEARASAMIIGALPFVVTIAVSATSPGYMSILYTDPRGNMCAAVAVGMMLFGAWVMSRMTKFEI